MKKALLLIFLPLVLGHFILHAQSQGIKIEDSLLNQVAIQTSPQSKIQLFLELNKVNIATQQNAKSLHYAEKALLLAKENKLRTEQATSYIAIGSSYFALKDYPKALDNYNKAFAEFQQLNAYRQQIITLYNIGQLYDTDLCDYSTALDYYNRALSIENKHNDIELKAQLYLNIGALYKNSSNDKKALENLNHALSIAKQHGIKKIVTNCLSVLGNFYANKDDLSKAIKYYDEAIEIKKQLGDEQGEGSDYVNLAFIYQVKSDYQTSLNYLQETFRIAQKYNANGLLLMYEKDMGILLATAPDSILLSMGINPAKRLETAIQYELRALKLGEKINPDYALE